MSIVVIVVVVDDALCLGLSGLGLRGVHAQVEAGVGRPQGLPRRGDVLGVDGVLAGRAESESVGVEAVGGVRGGQVHGGHDGWATDQDEGDEE